MINMGEIMMMEKFVAVLVKFSLVASVILAVLAIGVGICILRYPETCIRLIMELIGLLLVIGGIYVLGHILIAAVMSLFRKKQ